jgi:hypothetical protein
VGVAGEALDVGQERWDPIQAFMRPLRCEGGPSQMRLSLSPPR